MEEDIEGEREKTTYGKQRSPDFLCSLLLWASTSQQFDNDTDSRKKKQSQSIGEGRRKKKEARGV